MSHCDCEPAEVCVREYPRAKKTWQCCECGEAINIGEQYTLFSVLYDGSWSRERMCATCDVWETAFHAAIRAHNVRVREQPLNHSARSYIGSPPPAFVGPRLEYVCDCWCFGEMWSMIGEFCREALDYEPNPRQKAA